MNFNNFFNRYLHAFSVVLLSTYAYSSDLLAEVNLQPFKLADSTTLTISSNILDRSYDLYIKLPRGYFAAKNRNKNYPIIYLNDGPHTFKVAAGVTHFPSMDKAIIVGISFAHGENGQYSRVRDLTPNTDKTWTRYITGGAPQFLSFIKKEVFPLVEKKYRVNSSQRILSGHSLGGSFGAWVLLTEPSLFAGYILSSPSLWFNNHFIFELEHQFAKTQSQLPVTVFIATGALETKSNGMKQDMVADHQRFVNQLRERGYKDLVLFDEIVQHTDHYSTFPVALAKGLNLLFRE